MSCEGRQLETGLCHGCRHVLSSGAELDKVFRALIPTQAKLSTEMYKPTKSAPVTAFRHENDGFGQGAKDLQKLSVDCVPESLQDFSIEIIESFRMLRVA